MADLKTTNIFGDAYINNKVGIATNAPATRLQIGQLSPTAATEGIQFGDDTSTRIYRSGTGAITVAGSLTYPSATVSGYITFPNDTNAAGLINTAGTAWLKLDDAYGNMYIVNNQAGAGIYFDSNAYYWRNSNASITLLSLSGNGDLGAARYLSGTYVNTSDDVSTGNISHIVAKFGDNYHRSATAAKVAAFISGQTMNIGGNAATVTTNANLSGDVTSVGNTTTIANTVVTNAKLKEMGASTIKGNNGASANTPSDLTPAQVATMLSGQTMNIAGSSTSCTGNAATATALTSMNISQFTNNSGYLTSAVTSLVGTTNRITVSGATGAVTLNLPQDIHTGASPTFAGLSLTSVSTTGATITNLTGAYQNTTVYDSAKTQSATPSRGIRAPASSIQFTDSYAIAPFYTYRSTGDWPVPYGIGWGTGGESSGIFQRYASNGSSFGDMIFYTGNDGSGAFSFRRHTWEGTAHFAAGSGELSTELFRVDWAGNVSIIGGFTISHPGSGYAQFSNWVKLGTSGFFSDTNSAHIYPNNASYGSWRMDGTRNGWGGIEFGNNGVSLMMGSDTVGFHQNTNGWLFRVHNGSGFIYKGSWGGGTAATIYDTSNGNGVLLRTASTPAYGDWNSFGNNTQTTNAITQEYFNVGIGSSTPNSNFPSVVAYRYGILTNLGSGADARAQIYISHAGDDLIFRGGWGTASWQTWNRCLTNINSPYAYNMNQYVRTTDGVTFANLYTTGDYEIKNAAPTITFRDTDHRTGFIHVNSNIFYVLTGVADSARGNWGQVANSRWPMELNLSNNNATFGADVNAISFTGAGTGLTGTASSLSIGGNAATATTLQTGRAINGTSFNGSAAITTATWGTARTLTIGSTGKSVDGSAAITWSLAEIGAAATNGASNQNFSANSIYPYEWIRFMVDAGIYWQSGTYTGWHIHPQAAWGMSFRSAAATDCGLQLRRSDATSLGAVYSDGTSIGFLTAAFGWGASWTLAGVMNRGSVPGSLVTGNIGGNAATSTLATKASTLSQGGGNGTGMTFNWSGQSGQPTWLWGSNDGTNIYVWNPSNFNVNSATTATTANALNTSNSYTIAGLTSNGTISIFPSYVSPYSSFLRMGYDNSGNYEYTIKRDGTTGFLEFYNTQANYTGYYFRINGSGGGLGIAVSPASRLHVNGDGTNPAVRVDNTGVVLAASVGSNGRTFYGWLPISVDGTTRWIRIFS